MLLLPSRKVSGHSTRQSDGQCFYAMELVEGETLEHACDAAVRYRRNDDKKVEQILAWMRKRAFCGMSSSMLLERFPEVQSLGPEDKWRLIDELWSDLAQQVEGEAPNQNIVELLEKRFSDYLVDPSQGQPVDDAFARLAEHKRRWK